MNGPFNLPWSFVFFAALVSVALGFAVYAALVGSSESSSPDGVTPLVAGHRANDLSERNADG